MDKASGLFLKHQRYNIPFWQRYRLQLFFHTILVSNKIIKTFFRFISRASKKTYKKRYLTDVRIYVGIVFPEFVSPIYLFLSDHLLAACTVKFKPFRLFKFYIQCFDCQIQSVQLLTAN